MSSLKLPVTIWVLTLSAAMLVFPNGASNGKGLISQLLTGAAPAEAATSSGTTSSIHNPATWYFDSTGGNDTTGKANDTTHPFKTLSKLNSLMTSGAFLAGDTAAFKKGSAWNESLNIPISGAAGNSITFTAYGSGASPLFYDETKISGSGWSDDGAGKYHLNLASSSCTSLYEDGVFIPQATNSALTSPSSGPRWYFDSSSQTVYYAPSTGTPSNHILSRSTRGSAFSTGINPLGYITLDGLSFHHVSNAIYLTGSTSANVGGVNYIAIQNCNFSDLREGIFLLERSNNENKFITIRNNTFDYCGTNIYIATAATGVSNDNIYIGYNKITHSNTTKCGVYFAQSGDADGISLQNLSNSTIEHNDISGVSSRGNGITHWTDYTSTVNFNGNKIQYNYIHDVDGGGIDNDAATVNSSDHSCNIIWNIITNFGRLPSSYAGIKVNSPQSAIDKSLIANNVIYNGQKGVNGLWLYSGPDYYVVKNNIISTITGGGSLVRTDVRLNHNEYSNNDYDGGSTGSPFDIGGSAQNWTQWQSATNDASSLTVNPGWNSPLNENFHLLSDSPVIDKGDSSIWNGVTDFFGSTIPSGSPVNIGVD